MLCVCFEFDKICSESYLILFFFYLVFVSSDFKIIVCRLKRYSLAFNFRGHCLPCEFSSKPNNI